MGGLGKKLAKVQRQLFGRAKRLCLAGKEAAGFWWEIWGAKQGSQLCRVSIGCSHSPSRRFASLGCFPGGRGFFQGVGTNGINHHSAVHLCRASQPASLHVSPYRTCRNLTYLPCLPYLSAVCTDPYLVCLHYVRPRRQIDGPLSMSNVHPAELTLIGIQCVDARPGSTLIVDSPSLSMGKSKKPIRQTPFEVHRYHSPGCLTVCARKGCTQRWRGGCLLPTYIDWLTLDETGWRLSLRYVSRP